MEQESGEEAETCSEGDKLQDLPPCWGLDIVCGKGTDFNYGPWADRQRCVMMRHEHTNFIKVSFKNLSTKSLVSPATVLRILHLLHKQWNLLTSNKWHKCGSHFKLVNDTNLENIALFLCLLHNRTAYQYRCKCSRCKMNAVLVK